MSAICRDSQLNTSRPGARSTLSLTDNDTWDRLHMDHERYQKSKAKIESNYEQKLKEECPFQPTRITKGKERVQGGSEMKETS